VFISHLALGWLRLHLNLEGMLMFMLWCRRGRGLTPLWKPYLQSPMQQQIQHPVSSESPVHGMPGQPRRPPIPQRSKTSVQGCCTNRMKTISCTTFSTRLVAVASEPGCRDNHADLQFHNGVRPLPRRHHSMNISIPSRFRCKSKYTSQK
jgi:hypothetical protein